MALSHRGRLLRRAFRPQKRPLRPDFDPYLVPISLTWWGLPWSDPESTSLLPSLVDLRIEPDDAAPSVQFHYRTFSPTTSCSAPVPRFGTLILMGTAHLDFSLHTGTTGSHVPRKSLEQVHATFMPDATWTVDRFLPDCSRVNECPPVLTPSGHFSTRQQWFAHARLLTPYLTRSCPAFSSTLTTTALDRCSLRRFEAYSCKSAPRGLPSSLMQHGCLARILHKLHHQGTKAPRINKLGGV
jgi:hypothetical protein